MAAAIALLALVARVEVVPRQVRCVVRTDALERVSRSSQKGRECTLALLGDGLLGTADVAKGVWLGQGRGRGR